MWVKRDSGGDGGNVRVEKTEKSNGEVKEWRSEVTLRFPRLYVLRAELVAGGRSDNLRGEA